MTVLKKDWRAAERSYDFSQTESNRQAMDVKFKAYYDDALIKEEKAADEIRSTAVSAR